MDGLKRGAGLTAIGAMSALLMGAGVDGAAASASPQGDNYFSIAKLPDWSGFWAYHRVFVGPPREHSGPGGEPMYLTAQYDAIEADHRARRAQENLSYCLPAGATGVMQHRLLFQFLFTPGEITMLFEDGEVRRIHTDRRTHVPLSDLTRSYMGDSIGHWDGDTLVVDTIGFPNADIWENYGVQATINTRLAERFFRNGKGYIEVDSVLTDQAIFAKPYIYRRLYEASGIPITEPQCQAGNRDTGTSVDLTPPPLGS